MSVSVPSRTCRFDFLTEILETFPLSIRFAGRLNLTTPWGIDLPESFAAICCVAHGDSYLVAGEDDHPVLAEAGDIFVLSPTVGHRLQHATHGKVLPVEHWLQSQRSESHVISVPSCGKASSIFLGGFLELNGVGPCPLYGMLPPIIHLRRDKHERIGEFDKIIRLFEQELSFHRPGQQAILNRLVEILFIRIVQLGLSEINSACANALHGLSHPDLAATLALIHREPEKPWTVSSLAQQAAMSRSTFSATFLKVLGKPPLQYLRDYRMQLACRLLQNPAMGLKEIATRVGYDSTSAFSTAFKRAAGIHPSGYRQRGTQHKSLEPNHEPSSK